PADPAGFSPSGERLSFPAVHRQVLVWLFQEVVLWLIATNQITHFRPRRIQRSSTKHLFVDEQQPRNSRPASEAELVPDVQGIGRWIFLYSFLRNNRHETGRFAYKPLKLRNAPYVALLVGPKRNLLAHEVDTHGLTPVALAKEVCIYLEGCMPSNSL